MAPQAKGSPVPSDPPRPVEQQLTPKDWDILVVIGEVLSFDTPHYVMEGSWRSIRSLISLRVDERVLGSSPDTLTVVSIAGAGVVDGRALLTVPLNELHKYLIPGDVVILVAGRPPDRTKWEYGDLHMHRFSRHLQDKRQNRTQRLLRQRSVDPQYPGVEDDLKEAGRYDVTQIRRELVPSDYTLEELIERIRAYYQDANE